jgi:acetylornithine/succinyldiaminopimelate/putrescine aminotransferase
MQTPASPFADRAATFAAFSEHVNPGKVETYERYGLDVVMGRREGVFFWDAFDGRRFFNAHCNGGVFNLGHRHPLVLEAVRDALETLDIGNHHLVSGTRARLAERLSASTGGQLGGVVFGVSGGEAVDLALKVCRWATGRSRIVSARGGYHGHTGLALAAGDPSFRDAFGPNAPGFEQVPFNDVAALERALDDDAAAVILETIPATAGVVVPHDGYLQQVRALCDARGAKLILDEVQTGLGRTGRVWGYQHDDVQPDVVVTGKGLSGGVYPITATLMTDELHALFQTEPFIHISTFGGAEPGCAAALAVLALLEAPGFLQRVEDLGERFTRGLSGLPCEVRGRGLMMALKFPVADAGLMAAKLLFDAGIFAVYAGNDTSVVQFLPPLITSDDEADDVIATVRQVFGS